MSDKKGTIYLRDNAWYRQEGVVKMGIASFAKDRSSTYITGEIERGEYLCVIEIPLDKMRILDKCLKNHFKPYHVYKGGGTEFYSREIYDSSLVINYLKELRGIEYRVLTEEEIAFMNRCNRLYELPHLNKLKNIFNDLHLEKIITRYKNKKKENKKKELDNVSYSPRSDQVIIIEKSVEYLKINDKGILVLMCGVGKTLISLWITQNLMLNTLVIGVPNLLLLAQWEEVIHSLFANTPYITVSGGIKPEHIIKFLETNREKCIVLTTYSSSHKVYTSTESIGFVFGMKILDEAHHLTTTNMEKSHTTKTFVQMLNIKSHKQLALTATLKQIENTYDNENIVSNDSISHFGEVIDRKCLLWAIGKNIVCDYLIQTIIADEEELNEQFIRFNIIEDTDKRLFLSAFASLKSIYEEHSHHLLIYSNNKDNSFKIIQYIKILLKEEYFNIPNLYYSNYHSEMNSNVQEKIINDFDNAPLGIITCVYCLGEGWDFPRLDAVVFSENMTSNIRIVQSALRASRKNKYDPNKKTKIILPILNREDWLENTDNVDLKKVREVIYQIGLEDETIMQKVKVFKINVKKQPLKKPKPQPTIVDEFGEYDEKLTQRLRLKTVQRTALSTSYEKARKIIADKNIRSKEEYYALCDIDNRLNKEPEIVFKGQFISWIEYLNISRIYYDLDTCKYKVADYLSKYPEIKSLDLSKICMELCKIDEKFPPNGLWVDYYKVKDLRDLIVIILTKKKKQSSL